MKDKRTELNLTVSTDYTHNPKDVIESVRQRIEVTSFHLQSLFGFIKRSAILVESKFDSSEDETVKGFAYDLINFSDLGEGLALSIWATISDLTELQTKDETPAVIDADSENAFLETDDDGENYPLESTDSSRTLAGVISALITNPNVPDAISEALQDAVNEIMNASKQTEVLEYEKSAEYITKVLRDYRQTETENN